MAVSYIGLGSNRGDPAALVRRAFDSLAEIGTVRSRSSLYRTRPWGYCDQPDFINAVAEVETALAPRTLLEALQAIETRLGRTPSPRWHERAIDLDILLYDDLAMAEPGLIIPHLHLRERAFALVPLAEIAPRFSSWRDDLETAELESVELLNPAKVAVGRP